MYFERQQGKQCVIHAWNNGAGKRQVTFDVMTQVAREMVALHCKRKSKNVQERVYKQLIGPGGVSPTVLWRWIDKKSGSHIKSVHRFKNVTELRSLWTRTHPDFLLVGTTTQATQCRHQIAIRKENTMDFLLLDSELRAPIVINSAKAYNRAFSRYYITDVVAVLTGPPPASSEDVKVVVLSDEDDEVCVCVQFVCTGGVLCLIYLSATYVCVSD